MVNISRISYGATAAIVTSMGLIAGLEAADAKRPAVVAALLIAAIADNLTDSLSIHMYQESERLPAHEAFVGTLSNFAARLIVCMSFVALVVLLSAQKVLATAIAWGFVLLVLLTWLLARERGESVPGEIIKHVVVAAVVLVVSNRVGTWLGSRFSA